MIMDYIALILQSVLCTVSAVWFYTIVKLAKQTKNYSDEVKKLLDDLAVVNNQNAETMKNLIAKVSDCETKIALSRKARFNENL